MATVFFFLLCLHFNSCFFKNTMTTELTPDIPKMSSFRFSWHEDKLKLTFGDVNMM